MHLLTMHSKGLIVVSLPYPEYAPPLARENRTVKRALILLSTMLLFLLAPAQTYLTRYDYYTEPVLINPAITAYDYLSRATIAFNSQYMHVSPSPNNFFVSGQMRLGRFNIYDPKMLLNRSRLMSHERVGVGAGFYTDSYGPFRESNVLLTYSYHIPTGPGRSLSFGLTGKITHFGADNAEISARDPGDPLTRFEDFTYADINAGAFLNHKQYYAGISATDLLKYYAADKYPFGDRACIFITGGYRYYNTISKIVLEPGLVYHFDFTDHSNHLDVHTKISVTDMGWFSLSYQTIRSRQLGIVLALRVYRSLYVAYKFTNSPRETGLYSNGTHGIVLGKNFGVIPHTFSNE